MAVVKYQFLVKFFDPMNFLGSYEWPQLLDKNNLDDKEVEYLVRSAITHAAEHGWKYDTIRIDSYSVSQRNYQEMLKSIAEDYTTCISFWNDFVDYMLTEHYKVQQTHQSQRVVNSRIPYKYRDDSMDTGTLNKYALIFLCDYGIQSIKYFRAKYNLSLVDAKNLRESLIENATP